MREIKQGLPKEGVQQGSEDNKWDPTRFEHVVLQNIQEVFGVIELINGIIYLNKRNVGILVGKTFFTDRTPREHFYVLGRGYPIADETILWLKERNADKIIIKEHRKDGVTMLYVAKLEQYLKGGMIQHEPFEPQRNVPLDELIKI